MGKGNDTGLKLGKTVDPPGQYENGLHLGQWMDRDGGLQLGKVLRDSEPVDLIVNGEFSDPGVGFWHEDVVPGWYVPTTGPGQDIQIAGSPASGFHGVIALTESIPLPGSQFPQIYGEIAQDVEARTGDAYTLQWTVTDISHRYPTPPVEAIWNGEEVTATIVERTGTTMPPFVFTTTYQATVYGQPGTDTLTFRAEFIAGSAYWDTNLDSVSLLGVPDGSWAIA